MADREIPILLFLKLNVFVMILADEEGGSRLLRSGWGEKRKKMHAMHIDLCLVFDVFVNKVTCCLLLACKNLYKDILNKNTAVNS